MLRVVFFGYVDEITKGLSTKDSVEWRVKVHQGSNVLAAIPPDSVPKSRIDVICSMMTSNIEDLIAGEFDENQVSETALKHIKHLSEMVGSVYLDSAEAYSAG